MAIIRVEYAEYRAKMAKLWMLEEQTRAMGIVGARTALSIYFNQYLRNPPGLIP